MPIVMKVVKGPDHLERLCSVVVCDHCHTEIEDARSGSYQWRGEDVERSFAQVYFTHKRCFRGFEETHPESYWLAEELRLLPAYLGGNLSVNRKEARGLARRLGELEACEAGPQTRQAPHEPAGGERRFAGA
jgi:hypothetical protein